jgi:glycosyltransferase involved in cell wall biosynthesis/predicted O-methyltransferase YrrM
MNKPNIPSVNLVERQQRIETALHPAYTEFLRLVKARGLTTGVEIGVGFGGHCASLLEYRGIDALTGVDPYTSEDHGNAPHALSQQDMDRVHDIALDRLAKFGRRFELLRKPSLQAVSKFENGSLDFVYLDGDQGFDAVGADLGAWFDKIREGGIIAGHDYDNPELPDVQQAVDGFFQRLGWTVHHAGQFVWWVEKKRASVSYVIPAYNAEDTLWQATASVMEDNYVEGDELIIVDDGSTDSTGIIIDKLADAYPDIRTIYHTQNFGAAVARNRAVTDATHDLIMMLDADNLLPTDSVAGLRDHLITTNADAACFAQIRLFRDGDEPGETAWVHEYPKAKASLAQYCAMQDPPGAAGNLMFTREAWYRAGGYPEDVAALDSWGFGLRMVATGSKLSVCPSGYYDHRIGHNSYWQREHEPGRTDRLALSLLKPYFNRLSTASQLYLLQSKNQMQWFTNLAERPLQLAGEKRGRGKLGLALNIQAIRQRLARLVSRAA